MKRAILVLGVVCMFAGSALALSNSFGGYLYYDVGVYMYDHDDNSATPQVGRPGRASEIWRTELTADWRFISETNTDNVNFNSSVTNTYNWSEGWEGFQVTVWDPRDQGGAGDLMISSIYNDVPGAQAPQGLYYNQAWDHVKVTPGGGAQTVVNDGEDLETNRQRMLVRVPNDTWMPGTNANGLGYITERTSSPYLYYFYDQNNDGDIDNDGTESTSLVNSSFGAGASDMEFGDDDCLYTTHKPSAGWPNYYAAVSRIWIDGTGTTHATKYFDPATNGLETARGILGGGSGPGLAVGPAASNPIVYLGVKDNVSDGAGGRIYRDAIFALQDVDGDNTILPGGPDIYQRVWYNGKPGSNVGSFHSGGGAGYLSDIEFWQNPDNTDQNFLVASGYGAGSSPPWGIVAVFELDSTGLVLVDDNYISSNSYKSMWALTGSDGFELDMSPIPEPATLLLLGTGALGVIGYVRRRRMT